MSPPLLRTGLVSISFRAIPALELIPLVAKAGQQGIEWGGDVHVPHGDIAKAELIARATRDAGLEVAAYGSYYRLGARDGSPDPTAVLDTAAALGAPTVRVWAGEQGSAKATASDRRAVEDDARAFCAAAAARGLRVCLEYHGGTLTDTPASAAALLDALPLANLDSLWQPPVGQPPEVCEQSLRDLLPRVSNLHVFHWGPGGWKDRHPLADGTACWTRYLSLLAEAPAPRWALLEFFPDDRPEPYLEDARTLRELVDRTH